MHCITASFAEKYHPRYRPISPVWGDPNPVLWPYNINSKTGYISTLRGLIIADPANWGCKMTEKQIMSIDSERESAGSTWLSRRGFLKVGLFSATAVVVVTITGVTTRCSFSTVPISLAGSVVAGCRPAATSKSWWCSTARSATRSWWCGTGGSDHSRLHAVRWPL